MAILMQGSWTLSVKSKNAAFPQRFVIEGAASGNGSHAGDAGAAAVLATGASWTVRVQHNPGSGWQDSDDQITSPTSSAGQYHFDIQSNDSGADHDFDDLVLTCTMPATATDFLVFGHVSSYRGACLFNPCFPHFVVIESAAALAEALKYPALREVLKKLYPERLKPGPPNPPDPSPFRPLVLSLADETPIPAKQNLAIRVKSPEAALADKAKRSSAPETRSASIASVQNVAAARFSAAAVTFDRLGLSALVERSRLACHAQALPGAVIGFQEYDRTAAELLGGPYTGAGGRENLGVTVTDRNGNYIFRFSRSIPDFFDEAGADTALDENFVTQSAPDLIARLIDFMAPGTTLWETAPYFNIPNLRRINICILEGRVHPTRCISGQIIQSLGNVFVGTPPSTRPFGEPPGFGPRVGFSNFLGLEGRITARNLTGPQTRCAAWYGRVDLFGCFLDHPTVARYTIRYRGLNSGTPWTFLSQELLHPLKSKVSVPGYSGELIGPSFVSLHVDGGPLTPTPAYTNIEQDSSFVSTHIDRRAQIRTGQLNVPMPGSVQFWIEGYDAAGHKVAGAEDSVTLYVDNSAPFVDIDDNVTMGGASLGNCAKFKLPAPGAALTVKFKVDQAQGFVDTYELSMNKGAIGAFAVTPPPPVGAPFRLRSYVHGDDLSCSQLRGTFDDPVHDLSTGYVTLDLTPASGHWLETAADPPETFCAFSLNLYASTRVTDGYTSGACCYTAIPVLIGIEA